MEEKLRKALVEIQRELARIDKAAWKHAKLEGAQIILLHLLGIASRPYRELLKGEVEEPEVE